MSKTRPQETYKNAVVLYHWRKCPHCVSFMSAWAQAKLAFPPGTKTFAIEVEDNKARLEQLGVDLGGGVPRVVLFNKAGEESVYAGARTADALVDATLSHLGGRMRGGGESDPALDAILTTPDALKDQLPALVLYFRHNCGFCVRFLPTFLKFAASSGSGTVLAVDTSAHPGAMGALQPDARSAGVPHVVWHAADGAQTAFNAERTVVELRKFVKQTSSSRQNVSFEGGSLMPLTGGVEARLERALDALQKRARTTLGAKHARVFEPDHSAVSFVGVHTGSVPARDRVYILISPTSQPRGKPTAHATIYGSRTGALTAKIYVNKDTSTLLRNKRSSGFTPVMETDPHVAALQTFGYHVGLS